MKRTLFGTTSKLRGLLDLAWIVAFAAVLVLLYSGRDTRAAFDGRVELSLIPSHQTRGIYLQNKRVGSVEHQVERHGPGWRITERFYAQLTGRRTDVGWSRLVLREDLSLESLSVSADPARLARLMGVGDKLASLIKLGTFKLHGSCWLRNGRCRLQGRIGDRRVDQLVTAGRGPVVPSAILPLLARGVLGNRAELAIFNPMSLSRNVVTYEIVGREQLTLRGKTFNALRLKQNVQGMNTALWIDEKGRVLKEQLPMGLWVEHEAWR